MDETVDFLKKEGARLIDKSFDDFSRHVVGGDLTSILLKGHIFIEHYLDHAMVLLKDKKADVKNKTFNTKIRELRGTNCFFEHETAVSCLFALNEIRNDLAHQLGFQLTLTQLDAIGYYLGKEYLIKRYASENEDSQKELLLWVLRKITMMVFFPIWYQIRLEKSKLLNGRQQTKETSSNSSGTIQVNNNPEAASHNSYP